MARVNIDSFALGPTIGEGAYGKVLMARKINTDTYYAIKTMKKAFIAREGKVQFVMNEKNALALLRHPFIVKLYYTFQDKENLYYVEELCRGSLTQIVEYYRNLNEEKGIEDRACPEDVIRFYIAEILNALDYMHIHCHYIHRDLKPENILLTETGHIKLTDFGTAKSIGELTSLAQPVETVLEDPFESARAKLKEEHVPPKQNSIIGVQQEAPSDSTFDSIPQSVTPLTISPANTPSPTQLLSSMNEFDIKNKGNIQESEDMDALYEANNTIGKEISNDNINESIIDEQNHDELLSTNQMNSDNSSSYILNPLRTRSNTFCGTSNYVSPEVLDDKGAYIYSDIWALGCIIYYMYYGKLLFIDDTDYIIFNKIEQFDSKSLPQNDMSDNLYSLLVQFLSKNEEDRLQCSIYEIPTYYYVYKHPFFSNFSFESLPNQTAAYIPKLKPLPIINDSGWNESEYIEEELDSEDEMTVSPFAQFLLPTETLVKTSSCMKLCGILYKKRQLILTSTPRLLYIDPQTMLLRGDIPLNRIIKLGIKGKSKFIIELSGSPTKKYTFDDQEKNANSWIYAIKQYIH